MQATGRDWLAAVGTRSAASPQGRRVAQFFLFITFYSLILDALACSRQPPPRAFAYARACSHFLSSTTRTDTHMRAHRHVATNTHVHIAVCRTTCSRSTALRLSPRSCESRSCRSWSRWRCQRERRRSSSPSRPSSESSNRSAEKNCADFQAFSGYIWVEAPRACQHPCGWCRCCRQAVGNVFNPFTKRLFA